MSFDKLKRDMENVFYVFRRFQEVNNCLQLDQLEWLVMGFVFLS